MARRLAAAKLPSAFAQLAADRAPEEDGGCSVRRLPSAAM